MRRSMLTNSKSGRLTPLWAILCLAAVGAAPARTDESLALRHRGFEAFAQGTLGNSGANLYVSQAGHVQTINRWDLNRDGYLDLVFTQDHSDLDDPEALIYWNGDHGLRSWLPERWQDWPIMSLWRLLSSAEHERAVTRLPAEGGGRAMITDLNGDGYPEIVFCNMMHNFRPDQPVYLYWGSPQGYSLERRTRIPAYQASGLAAGDLNGDGFPDLVVANSGDELGERYGFRFHLESYVYWGAADGYAETRRLVLPTVSARGVALGDFSGNGWRDVAFINHNSQETSAFVYWNREGALSAEDRQVLSAEQLPPGPTAVIAGDFHQQGRDGLAIAGGSEVRVFRAGPEGLVEAQTLNMAGHVADLAASDLDGDGHLDLVAVGGNLVSIVRGGPEGLQAEGHQQLPAHGASSVSVGDLDGDGRDDLLIGNTHGQRGRMDGPSYVYWNGPQGFSPYRRQELLGSRVAGTALGDLNRNGKLDVLLVNRLSGPAATLPALIYWGNPDHYYSCAAVSEVGTGSQMMLSCADLDDDGWPDLIFLEGNGVRIWWGSEQGYSEAQTTQLDLPRANSTRPADLNGDGYLDLMVTIPGAPGSDSTVVIVWGDGTRLQDPRTTRMPFAGPYNEGSAVADLNRNGYLDLILPVFGGSHSEIKWGSAEGYAAENRTLLRTYGAGAVQVADLDADGWLDVVFTGDFDVVTQSRDTKTIIYWGGPEGFSEAATTQLESYAGVDLAAADLNRDGHLDLIFTSYQSATARDLVAFIYWGGPGRTFSEQRRTVFNLGSSASVKALDLNQDGWLDLVLTNHKLHHAHALGSGLIYWGGPQGFRLEDSTSLPVFGNHKTLLVDPGNLYHREPWEEYFSPPLQAPPEAEFSRLEWIAQTDPGTAVKFQVRAAADLEPLSQAAWLGPQGPESYYQTSGEALAGLGAEHRWLQYRAVFTSPSGGGSARLAEVVVHCASR